VNGWRLFQLAFPLAISGLVASASAQTATKDEIIQKLVDRVDALEREVAALEQRPAPSSAPPVVPPQAVAGPQSPAQPAEVDTSSTPADTTATDNTSRFTFHGYADASFLRDVNGPSVDDKRFALGELDLFASERLSTRITALVEVVLESDNQTLVADVPVNVERVLLEVHGNRYFNLDIGSYRTAIGFYSTAFLRGAWLQTALSRPLLFTFEDQGGFLPLHNVGLSANGEIPSGFLGLHYVAEVGSSRNVGENINTPFDPADNGAINGAIYSRPAALPGFQAGISEYRDRFSEIFGMWLHRSVQTAYAVYQAHGIEFLNEVALATFRHSADSYGRIPAGYSQIGYRILPSWTPYLRFEHANANGHNVGDLPRTFSPWRTVELGGVRYDVNDFLALKFEIGHETSWLQAPWIRAAMQVAFTF
jgi:hypothetical protein